MQRLAAVNASMGLMLEQAFGVPFWVKDLKALKCHLRHSGSYGGCIEARDLRFGGGGWSLGADLKGAGFESDTRACESYKSIFL